jgi:hypothetical protein
MNPKASFGVSSPSALRDNSTNQFRCASLSALEFHNKYLILVKYWRK